MKTDMNNKKKCTMCSELKDIEEYIKKCGRCRLCRKIKRREKYMENIDKKKAIDKAFHEKNREYRRAQQAEYYKRNKENIKAKRKEYRESDPEAHREKVRKYLASNLNLRLSINFRKRVKRAIQSGKKWFEYLGCTMENLKKWFEFNFELDGYNWDNYGSVWQIDHVIPCAKFDMTDEMQVYKCFNWRNTKPEHKNFNHRKGCKIYPFQQLQLELRLYLFDKQILENKKLTTAVIEKSMM